jgi:hypothetical protein
LVSVCYAADHGGWGRTGYVAQIGKDMLFRVRDPERPVLDFLMDRRVNVLPAAGIVFRPSCPTHGIEQNPAQALLDRRPRVTLCFSSAWATPSQDILA